MYNWIRDRRRSPAASIVQATAGSLGVTLSDSQGHETSFRWDEIKTVSAWKRDLLIVDEIMIRLESDDAVIASVGETDSAFESLIAILSSNLEGFRVNDGWREEVAFPAFATNETVLWERDS